MVMLVGLVPEQALHALGVPLHPRPLAAAEGLEDEEAQGRQAGTLEPRHRQPTGSLGMRCKHCSLNNKSLK